MSTEIKTTSAPVQAYRPEDYKRPQGLDVLKKMGKSVQASLAEAMPAFMRGQAPAMLRALYTECQKNPQLLNCSPESLFGSTIVAGQMGLMLGSALGQCYLIPFKGRVTLVTGYKGYIQLVNRSGQVGVISARTVYDRDQFRVVYGTNPGIEHIPGDYPTAKDVYERQSIAFYATCQTKQGATFACMSKAEAEVHRDKFALSKNGPWKDHFDAMAMKTCIIKLCKYLPMSAEVQLAVHIDEAQENNEAFDTSMFFQDAVEGLPEASPTLTKVDQLKERMRSAGDQPKDGKLFGESQGLPD